MILEVKDTKTDAIKTIDDDNKIEKIFKKIVNCQMVSDCFFAGIPIIYKELQFTLKETNEQL